MISHPDFDMVPVFEIYLGNQHYSIYVNGRVDGFASYEPMRIENRIPDLIAQEIQLVLNRKK